MRSMTFRRIAITVFSALVMTCVSLSTWARSTSPIPQAAAPTVLSGFALQPGVAVYATLTGSTSGGVWGDGIYTFDSDISTAAVHAGLLATGDTKTIKVTILPGQVYYTGATRNGVTSRSYVALYPSSYRLDADDGGDNPILSDPGSLRVFESSAGGVYRFKVTGNGRTGGAWGTNAYTSDSILAFAAVHSGVLVDGQIGVVRAVIVPPQQGYVGSTANGVSSLSYGQYSGAYAISNDGGSVPLVAFPGMLANPLNDSGSVSAHRGRNGASLYYKVTGSATGDVWGTGTYTDDSPLAVAAVHAGLLAVGQQGVVKVTIQPGLTNSPSQPNAYLSSTANGITSQSYGSYAGSYTLGGPDGDLGAIPKVNSVGSANAGVANSFRFQIAAKPAATSYNATGLPAGLAVESGSGLITGTPLVVGTFPVQLLVTNSAGTSNATLLIKVSSTASTASSPTELSLIGPATLQSAGRATISVSARFTDGTARSVTPTWNSSNDLAATVSLTGVLSAGRVTVDTPVTLTAKYTENGVTVQATLQVTISAAPATLAGLRLLGAASVQSGGQVRLTANALYSDGSIRPVSAEAFSLSATALGSVNSRGVLTVATVKADTVLTVTASYSEGGITKTASLAVSIAAAPAVLSRLTIIGARGSLASGESLSLSAEGVYDDGSRKPVTASWLVSGDAATISTGGVLVAMSVTQDSTTVVTASYVEGGITVTAQYQVVIQAVVVPTQVQAEVESTGPQSDFGLSIWSRLDSSGPAPTSRQPGATKITAGGQEGYKLYVVAVVPGGGILTSTAIFMLNRNAEWQKAGFPIAEYLAGVAENSFQLIEIFDHLDASIISGTKIFIGYGTSDTEMLETGRFRLVYQVQ